jgi:CheY-like chemotaxis protein
MNGKGKTVLLVEDNEDNRIVYSTILRHFGYIVTEALNGEEGISKARSEKPDLILMDISIPSSMGGRPRRFSSTTLRRITFPSLRSRRMRSRRIARRRWKSAAMGISRSRVSHGR